MNYEALGKRIRHHRKLQKMTQEDLAIAANVSTSYIGHIERGLKRCSLETLVSIANTLEVSIDMLLQDSLNAEIIGRGNGMSETYRTILNEIAGILREHDNPDTESSSKK